MTPNDSESDKGVKRRTDVVGIFTNKAAGPRLIGTVPLEIQDEWQVATRRDWSEGSTILRGREMVDVGAYLTDGAALTLENLAR